MPEEMIDWEEEVYMERKKGLNLERERERALFLDKIKRTVFVVYAIFVV